MDFCFYPNHEHGCPHVRHCPHLGGAALGTLVLAASENGQMLDMLRGQLDAARKSVSELVEENEQLKKQLELAKLELKLERQNKFATNQQKQAENDAQEDSSPACDPEAPGSDQPQKNGAHRSATPVGSAPRPLSTIGMWMYRRRDVVQTAKVMCPSFLRSIRSTICKKTSSTASIVYCVFGIQLLAATIAESRCSSPVKMRFSTAVSARTYAARLFICAT